MESIRLDRQPLSLPSLASVAPYVLWPLLIAGLGELILFRTLSRVGVHIPKEGVVLGAFNALTEGGSYAFNVASVATLVALLVLSAAVLKGQFGRRPLATAAAPALIGLAAASVLLSLIQEGPAARLVFGLVALAVMLALAGQALIDRRQKPMRSIVVFTIVLTYLSAQYHVLALDAYQALGVRSSPPAGIATLEVAEALVVLNAFLVFWVWSGIPLRAASGPSIYQLVTVGTLIALFLGSYYGRPDSSTASILSLWSLGLTLYLPVPIYALALGLYGAAIVRCAHRAHGDEAATLDVIALGLLPVAGLTLELTYQYLIALTALLLLTLANAEADSRTRNASQLAIELRGGLPEECGPRRDIGRIGSPVQ